MTGRKTILNLPNGLTLFRIFLVPVLVVLLLTRFQWEHWLFFNREELAVAVFLIAALTDFLDGWVARRRKQITTLGQLLDPIADKLLTSAALISLVTIEPYNRLAWMVVVIIGREIAVTGLRAIASSKGVIIAASPLGKGKTTGQVIAITALILGEHRDFHSLEVVGMVSLSIVTVLALLSGVDYFWKFFKSVEWREGDL